MIHLEEHKSATHHTPVENAPLPRIAYLALSQHIGKACDPLVKIGETVSLGQKIASTQAQVFAPIHASVSGKVTALQDWPHPVVGRCKAILIENDGQDTPWNQPPRSPEEIARLSPAQIRELILEAGVVGMGGASFPTHIKLAPSKPVDTLIVNGAECEPYLTGDFRLMMEKPEEILKGIGLAEKCLGVKHIVIAIEDNKPEAIEQFNRAVRGTTYEVRSLKSHYPQGGEKQLIKNILKKEVPAGKLPLEIGVVVQNVATLNAIYEAVYLHKPLFERVVTVTGSCLTHPKNVLARIGTPIKTLIDFCGPLKEPPAKIIIGGPMMGFAQYSQDTPLIKSTNGIILLSKAEVKETREDICIRCSRCVEACPVGLMPCLINLASMKEKWELAKQYGCFDCMECGLCNYVCPQKRNIVQSIKFAKLKAPK